jgi:hypothetical protein
MLAPTPDDRLCDAQGRPYFLWDVDLTLDQFVEHLADPARRPYWLATLLRQAKPDDVFRFVSLDEIAAIWPQIRPGVGKMREFWDWRLMRWLDRGE